MPNCLDLAGQQFGRLTVLDVIDPGPQPRRRWRCRCQCGQECAIEQASLRSGHTTSCGCALKDFARSINYKHGRSRTPEYQAWRNIILRCYEPTTKGYGDYGAKGIRMCDRWRNNSTAFLDDMGPRPSSKHTIDRINPRGDYSPENCRWVTWQTQGLNRTNNVRVTLNGITQPVSEWARVLGLKPATIARRLRVGWTPEDALSTVLHKPFQHRNSLR